MWEQEIIIPESLSPIRDEEVGGIKDKLLSDDDLATWLNKIATSATKTINTKYDTFEVPDYTLRLKAIEVELKLKWHFKEKSQMNSLPAWIYVLR